jgi:hypothetical protein
MWRLRLRRYRCSVPMSRSRLNCTLTSSRKNVPRATLCVHTVTAYYRLWPPLAALRLFHRFRIPPRFRPFFLQSSPSHLFGISMKKLMKMIATSLLISSTKSQRKTCGKHADFLRKLCVVTCAKACGKPVEKWRISGGTAMEKQLADPAGSHLLSYCKVGTYATCSVVCAERPQDVGGVA